MDIVQLHVCFQEDVAGALVMLCPSLANLKLLDGSLV